MSKITTIIDIGSNSARMAIFKRTSQFGFQVIYEQKTKVRISQGCYENNGFLQEDSMQRAILALKDFYAISRKFKSKKLICVATQALRDAPNKSSFISLARKECSINIKVIDGLKEARFGAISCMNLSHKTSGVTIDIGGGSTELALFSNRDLKDMQSLNLGSIRLKELFFDKNDLKGALSYIQKILTNELESLKLSLKEEGRLSAFGIGGSIRAFGKFLMKKQEYPLGILHGYECKKDEFLPIIEKILSSSDDELLELGIEADRLDSIRPGVLILAEVIKFLELDSLIISGVGVREGVFLSDILRNHNYKFQAGFSPSIKTLQDNSNLFIKSSTKELLKANKKIFEAFKDRLDKKYLYFLQIACKLNNLGVMLNFYQAHKHSSYIVLNALNYGFSHEDRILIATLLENSHKKRLKEIKQEYAIFLPPLETLNLLCYTLAISLVLYNFSFTLSLEKDTLKIQTSSISALQSLKSISYPKFLKTEFSLKI